MKKSIAVIADANACMKSSLRALKPGGHIVIFDKFLPEKSSVSFLRRFMNVFSTFLGTDIDRKRSDMICECTCKIVHDEPSIGRGMYRVILLQKDTSVEQ